MKASSPSPLCVQMPSTSIGIILPSMMIRLRTNQGTSAQCLTATFPSHSIRLIMKLGLPLPTRNYRLSTKRIRLPMVTCHHFHVNKNGSSIKTPRPDLTVGSFREDIGRQIKCQPQVESCVGRKLPCGYAEPSSRIHTAYALQRANRESNAPFDSPFQL